jgi:hypothetical protein
MRPYSRGNECPSGACRPSARCSSTTFAAPQKALPAPIRCCLCRGGGSASRLHVQRERHSPAAEKHAPPCGLSVASPLPWGRIIRPHRSEAATPVRGRGSGNVPTLGKVSVEDQGRQDSRRHNDPEQFLDCWAATGTMPVLKELIPVLLRLAQHRHRLHPRAHYNRSSVALQIRQATGHSCGVPTPVATDCSA